MRGWAHRRPRSVPPTWRACILLFFGALSVVVVVLQGLAWEGVCLMVVAVNVNCRGAGCWLGRADSMEVDERRRWTVSRMQETMTFL